MSLQGKGLVEEQNRHTAFSPLASKFLGKGEFCPPQQQLFPHQQPFFLPLQDTIRQLLSMANCLPLKATAEIKATSGKVLVGGKTKPTHSIVPRVLHWEGQFYPQQYDFPRQPFKFPHSNELTTLSYPVILMGKCKVLRYSKPRVAGRTDLMAKIPFPQCFLSGGLFCFLCCNFPQAYMKSCAWNVVPI